MGRFLYYSDFFAVRIADYRGLREDADSKIRAIRFICLIRDSDIFRLLHNSDFFRGEIV